MTTETKERTRDLKKTVRLGRGDYGSVFCRIEYVDGKLSISGVEGPKANGDCRGGCGQIVMRGLGPFKEYAPGWDAETVAQFAELWDRWHLNHMCSACEHQRAMGWGKEKVELVTYQLKGDVLSEKHRIKRRHVEAIEAGETVKATAAELEILRLPFQLKQAPDADSAGSGRYKVVNRETTSTGWVRQDEHPQGVLSKPCPTCGYKYGSAWLREEVPADVIRWLANLPDTDRKPAWV